MVENRYGFHSGFMRFRAIGPGGVIDRPSAAKSVNDRYPLAPDQLVGDIVEIVAILFDAYWLVF
ncbi:hypothetical protein [Bradyrhizobium sp. CCBAU 53421]|uniref:hypothetical protein n=1 Tax=Bradyrhizobium sp. CCBAU 53421 TaxID=1325120 RepID=UPI001889F980|nr:hypothetical protein [Bradyrhizobium sp. CCBAU 53421]